MPSCEGACADHDSACDHAGQSALCQMCHVEDMPDWLRPLTGLTPVRHFVEVMRAVLLKDASWAELAPQLIALAGMGLAAVYATAAYVLRRRLG